MEVTEDRSNRNESLDQLQLTTQGGHETHSVGRRPVFLENKIE